MNIILKINNASETVQSINLNTNLKQAVRVQAQNDVNYQLIDQNTGYAPENITTKRVGNDLQIAFEGSDIEQPDLIIEDYYDQDNSNLLVGTHENGNLYPYVPETGVQTDAVTLLAQEVSVGQALGGEALKSAMWAFNPWWLLALVPIAGIAIAAGHDSSSGSKDTTPPGAPTVTANVGGSVDVVPPSEADTKTVTIRYTDENGVEHTSTVEKGNNGKWTSTDTNLIVDENTGKTTIPADKVKDNTKVTANATDNSGNKGSEGDAISGIDQVEGKPGIIIPEAQDGYINGKELEDGVQTQIILPKGTIEGATVTVTITKPDGTTEQISHTVTGDEVTNGKIDLTIPKESLPADGNYKVGVSIQQGNNPAVSGDTESFELDTGIPGDVDNNGEASNGDTDSNTKDGAPIVTITDGNGDDYINAKELEDGIQTKVTIPTGTKAGDTITVSVTDPNGKTVEIPHTVTEDDIKNGSVDITIPKDNVPTDGDYTITAKVTDPAGNTSATSEPKKVTVDTGIPGDVDNNGEASNGDTDSNTKDGAPIVTITDGNGDEYINAKELEDGVTTKVTIPANTEVGDEITLTVTDPKGNKSEVTHKVTKDDIDNGSAEVTIPKDKVPSEGDYTVTAKVTDPAGNSSAESTPAGFTVDKTAPAAPTVTANDDGSMTIAPPADEDTKTVEITYTGEDGNEHPATLTKGDDGKWKSDNPDVVVDKDTGVATIAKDKVKDGSTVTAKAKDNAGNTGDDASAEAKPNSDDLSGKPELTIAEADDGKVTATELNDGIQTEVKLQTNSKAGDVVTLTITNPDNTTKTIEHTVTEDEATAGKVAVTIPKENVTTDGSYSVSVSQSRDGNATEGNEKTFTVDARVPGDKDGNGEADDEGKPIVHIEDKDDEIINASDLNKDGKATATITFPENAGYSVGDTLTVTYPDGKTEDIVLTEDNIKNGVKVTFTPLAAGESNEVKAIVKDPQGNSSKEGIDTAKTEEAEVPPTKIVVEVKDDFTDEYKGANTRSEGTEASGLLSGNGGLGKYEGVVGANGKTIDASDATKLQAIKTLADGLTNDATPTVTFTLDNKITSAQNMVIYRETVTKDGDVFNKEVLTNKFTVSADGKTYSFTDALPETFGTQYRYTAEVQNKATNAVELTTRQDIYLDTQVESMEVTAMTNNKEGNLTSITFSITDRSEVGAVVKISYPNTAGTTSTTTAEINNDGTYTVNLADNFNRYSTEGMQVTVIDSAGNIASTKTMYIRNLFSNMNTEMGPDPSQGRKFNVGLITDIASRQATNENGLKFTDDNDHLVVGLDEYARKAGVNGNMASMVGGGKLNVDTGAGDDHIQLRGNLQSWRGGSLKMGEGNDKLTFDTAEIATGGQYDIDFGNGNDRLVINGAVNVGATMNVSFGEGNDSMYVKSNLDGSGSGRYDFGNGDNSLEVGGYVTKSQTFLFGNGSDSFVVAGHVDYATVTMGEGNDLFKVGGNLRYGATVNMGEGDDVLVAGGINNGLDAQTVTVDMGEGNDTATFTSINGGKVDMGMGDDVLNISTLSGGTINLGAGDDIVNFSGRVTGGTVEGGEGNDIAVLKEVGHSYEMSNFKNVEIFDLTADGRQDINIRLSDLQQDGDTLAKVYIRGTSLDTVDLGNNNNYDDTAQNLKDTSNGITGSNVGTWAKGTEETVDGVTYDVYSYTSGNTGTITTELVYIEQGIQVI
ncbi:Ig-like domain-containing protein [Haemophilus parainfluenzae]|uniref:Ig-like domain-containing protein n=3 Tax=Haemophilus TaxID=724 RepID=UPI002E305D79|nr:Ig-like domain-containing protein [Haemophilus parainfluenzae]